MSTRSGVLDRIFPAVRAAEPAARLRVVGRKPLRLSFGRSKPPGVELHADVPDVRPFLATSGVMVVPLRIGGGSRLKILEALASGLPVISTRIGAEGLELVPGEHYIAADEPSESPRRWWRASATPAGAAMAERGRPRPRRYDWDALADRLERVWFDCRDRWEPLLKEPA